MKNQTFLALAKLAIELSKLEFCFSTFEKYRAYSKSISGVPTIPWFKNHKSKSVT